MKHFQDNCMIYKLVTLLMVLIITLPISAQEYIIKIVPGKNNPSLLCTYMHVGGYRMDNVIIDTGSTTSQLNYKDYIQLKISGILTDANLIGTVKTRNANGIITSKPKYRIPSMTIGSTTVHNMEVIFDSSENASRLLGLNYLKLFKSVTLDISDSTLILVK